MEAATGRSEAPRKDEKQNLRDAMRRKRRELSTETVATSSSSIFEHVKQFAPFSAARTIALYMPIDNEVDTSSLTNHLNSNQKKLCLPMVQPGGKLKFAAYIPGDELVRDGFGILQPGKVDEVAIDSIDLMFVPLVAFDAFGTRLGYGGGYYDRTLSMCRSRGGGPILVGLAYGFQEVELLPQAAHDVPLHYVATESGIRSVT